MHCDTAQIDDRHLGHMTPSCAWHQCPARSGPGSCDTATCPRILTSVYALPETDAGAVCSRSSSRSRRRSSNSWRLTAICPTGPMLRSLPQSRASWWIRPHGLPAELLSGRIPAHWVNGIARLESHRVPKEVPAHRWRQFINDCHKFLLAKENWAERAAGHSWSDLELFGCSRRISIVDPTGFEPLAGSPMRIGSARSVRGFRMEKS